MNLMSCLEEVESSSAPRILVLGDLMLDQYVTGDAGRVSPEAPVLVLSVTDQEVRPGGAAGVATFLRGLDADVTLAGATGADPAAATLRSLLAEDRMETSLLLTDESRPTTLKQRFSGRAGSAHGHQILRVDHESCDDLEPLVEEALCRLLPAAVEVADVIIVSDYAKGTCTPTVLQTVIRLASARGIPVIVDPGRGRTLEDYTGATLLKPNRREAEQLADRTIASPADAQEVAAALRDRASGMAVVITLDSDGCVVADDDHEPEHLPTVPRQVADITGAGDLFVALLARSLAAGLTIRQAASLANVAAGLEVERRGSIPVQLSEIRSAIAGRQPPNSAGKLKTLPELQELVASARGKRIVLTNGCFDLLHIGHVTCLQEAAALGDVLIVGLNSDSSVRQLKGCSRPVHSQQDRAALLAALSCVDFVVIYDETTPHRLLATLRPDVLAKGGDYAAEEVVGREVVEAYGGHVLVTSRINGPSTTSLLAGIRGTMP